MRIKGTLLEAAMAGAVSAMFIGAFNTASAHAAEIQIASHGPVTEIGMTQSVVTDPDIATVGAGVTTRAQTASEAMASNAVQMNSVIATLKRLGIKSEDIQTSDFNLNPQYQYTNNGAPPKFLGYDVSNRVSVVLRDLKRIGPTLDALAKAGANNFSGPMFAIENGKAASTQARGMAFRAAKDQAIEYARLAGYSDVRLLEVSENVQQQGLMPMQTTDLIVVSASKAQSTPIEQGRVRVAVTLNAKYEMLR